MTDMEIPLGADEREEIWSEFLQRWPIQALEEIQLDQYAQAGDKDCFVYWLEVKTEKLGSIWGGSAFKFGIYSRKDTSDKSDSSDRRYSGEYAWYAKYGESQETAFNRVKSEIIKVAHAARSGDLDSIEKVDLGQAVKWKLAFLYQDRSLPKTLPIYSRRDLLAALDLSSSSEPTPVLYKKLLANLGDKPLFKYADDCLKHSHEFQGKQALPEQALAYLNEQPERFIPVNTTKKLAGFITSSGNPFALVREQKNLMLFLKSGEWLGDLGSVVSPELYPVDRTRHSNLSSCAPELAYGHEAISVTLSSLNELEQVLEKYEQQETSALGISKGKVMDQYAKTQIEIPLNQILYGPPGTGKTFATIHEALRILDPEFLVENTHNRASLKNRYDELAATGHISFVTFHQSFSYEDFIEGLRASNDENSGQLRYDIVDGIFKSLCNAAAVKVTHQEEAPLDLSGRRIWKMSLGNTLGEDASIYDECIDGGYILLGYGDTVDFSGCTNRQDVEARFHQAGSNVTNGDYAVTSVTTFVTRMKPGDLVVVSDGNFKFRAIGEITGDYTFNPHFELAYGYAQKRNIKWLRKYEPSLPHGELLNNRFSQMTLYELKPESVVNMSKLNALLNTSRTDLKALGSTHAFVKGEAFGSGYTVEAVSSDLLELRKPNGKSLPLAMSILITLADYIRQGVITIEDIGGKKVFDKIPDSDLEPYLIHGYSNILPPLVERLLERNHSGKPSGYSGSDSKRVLIIDEINRGNISRIFGELITLIEPTKRKGASDALEAVLPYSKDAFSVPSNVYVVGTMNTADRSLSGLDIALRRRFVFKEMPPRPDLLDSVEVEGLQIGQMLRSMNDRIEVLLDRDHCLGHAYFMPLLNEPSIDKLSFVFRQQIIPLLQEYFFEDWERIQWVLNDHRKLSAYRFVRQLNTGINELFGDGVSVSEHHLPWSINEEAFNQIGAYKGIINHHLAGAAISSSSYVGDNNSSVQIASEPNQT